MRSRGLLSPIDTGMSMIYPLEKKRGGIFSYDGPVQVASCTQDAGTFPDSSRTVPPYGPRSTSMGSTYTPQKRIGARCVLFAL